MKRIGVVIAILALVGVAYGQSTQVLSRNAVGYVKKDLAAGYNLLANNWVEVGGAGINVQDVVDTSQLTKGKSISTADNLILWDSTPPGSYIKLFLYSSTGSPAWDGSWAAIGPLMIATNVIKVGEGAWYRNRGVANITWNEPRPYTWPAE